jgi:hypothetical protein
MASSGVSRRAAWTAVAAAGLIAGVVLPVAPASASALTVQLGCESLGESRIACDASVSGGTPQYSYRWSLGSAFGGGSVSFGCFPGSRPSVTVTVTDAVGATASATSGALCIGGRPR